MLIGGGFVVVGFVGMVWFGVCDMGLMVEY